MHAWPFLVEFKILIKQSLLFEWLKGYFVAGQIDCPVMLSLSVFLESVNKSFVK